MFAGASKSASICLQCRLRLAQSPIFHPKPLALHASTARRCWYSTAVAEAIREDGTADLGHRNVAEQLQHKRSKRRKTLGRSLRGLEIAALNTHSLGKPASVLVLHDQEEKRDSDLPTHGESRQSPQRKSDPLPTNILTEVEEEVKTVLGPLSPELIKRNLERFKLSFAQKDGGVSREQWDSLHDRIYDGFSQLQIKAYILEFDRSRASKDGASWTSQVSKLEANKHRRAAENESRMPSIYTEFVDSRKKSLVSYLLADCWGILRKGQKAVGRIAVRPWDMVVLLQHADKTLDSLKETYDAEIGYINHTSHLTIQAEPRSLEKIREVIVDFTNNIKSLTVHVHSGKNKRVLPISNNNNKEELFLSSLADEHGVAITPVDSRGLVTIRYHGRNYSDAENAKRDIFLARQSEAQKKLGLTFYPQGRYLCPPTSVESLNWRDKFHDWARWWTPVSKKFSPGSDLISALKTEPKNFPYESIVQGLTENPQLKADYGFSRSGISEKVLAKVGQVLIRSRPGLPLVKFDADHMRRHYNRPHAFLTDFPSLKYFFEHMNVQKSKIAPHDVNCTDRVRLVLLPVGDSLYPPITVILCRRENSHHNIDEMYATLYEFDIECLLPSCVSDIRFTRQIRLDLKARYGTAEGGPWASFEKHHQASRDSKASHHNDFPAFITIQMPNSLGHRWRSNADPTRIRSSVRRTVLRSSLETSDSSTKLELENTNEVEYMVGSTDAIDTAKYDYRGFQLVLEDIHGGQLAGDRSELSLSMSGTRGTPQKSDWRSFFVAACSVALKLGQVTGPSPLATYGDEVFVQDGDELSQYHGRKLGGPRVTSSGAKKHFKKW